MHRYHFAASRDSARLVSTVRAAEINGEGDFKGLGALLLQKAAEGGQGVKIRSEPRGRSSSQSDSRL